MSTAHLAEWIRWTGVVIAVAGVLIATPDGVSEVWRHIMEPGWMWGFWPFRPTEDGKAARDSRRRTSGPPVWADVIQPWEPSADDERKIEILHLQQDLLLEHVGRFRTETFARLAAVKQDLEQAEARLRAAHGELSKAISARDRLEAQIDARGLWPVGFGILLTGIPAELAYFHVLGIVVTAGAVVLTLWLAWGGISARRRAPSGNQAAADDSPLS